MDGRGYSVFEKRQRVDWADLYAETVLDRPGLVTCGEALDIWRIDFAISQCTDADHKIEKIGSSHGGSRTAEADQMIRSEETNIRSA